MCCRGENSRGALPPPALALRNWSHGTLLAKSIPPAAIERVSADSDDDHVLACAVAAQADLIVSGDPDLLNLKSYQHIPIVSPVEALKRLPQR